MEEVVDEALAAAKRGMQAAFPCASATRSKLALSKIIDVLGDRVSGAAGALVRGEAVRGRATHPRYARSARCRRREDRRHPRPVEDAFDDDAESIITNERYDAIGAVHDACVVKSTKGMTTTQKIDRVVTNRVLGLPLFAAIMFLVYFIAVSIGGGIVTDWANDGISGDGWLYTGGAQYEEAVGVWEEAVAAAEESGADEAALAALAGKSPIPLISGCGSPG